MLRQKEGSEDATCKRQGKRSDFTPNQHSVSLSLKLSALKKSNSDLEKQGKSVTLESKEKRTPYQKEIA